MRKTNAIVFIITFLLSAAHVSCLGAQVPLIGEAFDPEKAIRIVYEHPHGCDEVSGTINLKASVQGLGAPVPASMRYELRTSREGEPVVYTGSAPTYEAPFDSTTLRDGLVFFTAIPLDEEGQEINLKAAPYSAPGIIPPFRGFMINNNTLDLSKPLVILGSAIDPYVGELTGTWTAEQLTAHLIFSFNLMSHLRSLGFIPEMCFSDERTIVLDPSNPLADPTTPPSKALDLMGEEVAGTPTWNEGTACLSTPFFEIAEPNGLIDIWEHTALENVRSTALLGPVSSAPEVVTFFGEIVERLTYQYNLVWDSYNMFSLEAPMRGGDVQSIIKETLESGIAEGATSVLTYDVYHKANDFEMSAGAWPHLQEAIDEVNEERGTSAGLGAITTNDYQLMEYEGFLRGLYLSARELVKSSTIPSGMKVGIILAGHGSSTTNLLYDVSNIINNPLMRERIENYFSTRMAGIYASDTPCLVCYSEYANDPDDALRGVGEQVQEWIEEDYNYVFVFPMEWLWATVDIWDTLRKSAVELVDPDNEEILLRDERGRSAVVLEGTHLIVGESIFEQKNDNPAAYHFLRAAGVQLLENRLIALTHDAPTGSVDGEVSLQAGEVTLSLSFSDSLLARDGSITLQGTGIRAQGFTLDLFIIGLIIGEINQDDMSHYLFSVLAENALEVESVTIESATIALLKIFDSINGFIIAHATAEISGATVTISLTIQL
jgi:hypothetical protein